MFEEAVHSLRDELHVADVRNFGLAAAVELHPRTGSPGLRPFEVFERGLDAGLLLRFTGEVLAMAPPFVASGAEIRAMVECLRKVLRAVS